MTNLSEKTNIPIAWAASIIASIIGVVFSAGISYQKFNAFEAELQGYRQSQVVQSRVNQDQQLKNQRLDMTLGTMNEKLGSIDRKLDRMEKR